MKPLITNIVLDSFQNTLHFEECLYRNKYISEYFSKIQTQSEVEFLLSIVSHLVKVENNNTLEICPHCLGKKFDLFSDFSDYLRNLD